MSIAMPHTLPQLLGAMRALVKSIEATHDKSEGRWPEPDTGCPVCTLGTVPDTRNTGLCAYHDAIEILAEQS